MQAPKDRGRDATSPWQMPLRAWKEVVVRVWNQSWLDNIGLVAAGVAFYGFLAVVPLLGILVLTYGVFAQPDTVIEHVMTMLRVLPPDVVELIGQLLMNAVQSSEQTSGLGILLALLVALYAGGNGAGAVMTALNISYEEKERRSLLRFYLGRSSSSAVIAEIAASATSAISTAASVIAKAIR